MKLLDRDKGVDSSIKTSIFKLLADSAKFSEAELEALDSQIDNAIKEGRALWLAEELPAIVGADNAEVLKKAFRDQRFESN